MILFVYEGENRELRIHRAIQELYFMNNKQDCIVVSYCSNIYSLYNKMKNLNIFNNSAADLITLLKQEQKNNSELPSTLEQYEDSDAFSEIYLFFDYDIKHEDEKNKESVETQNEHIKEMLDFFDNETENGKLYINYPMVESIRYFKNKLPDNDYYTYTADLYISKEFKRKANEESVYKNLDFFTFKKQITDNDRKTVKQNWKFIKDLNVKKANYICNDKNEIPAEKSAVNQTLIFNQQLQKYVYKKQEVAILNSFPLFLYEYFM